MAARSRSRTRGGYKQRLGLPHRSKSRPALGTSVPVRNLQTNSWATHLATKFLTNRASATEAQEDAALSLAAGARGVQGIAKIGNSGKAQKNCSRDLKRLVHRGCTAPLPYLVSIPISNPKTHKVETVIHPVLLPHEMMEYIIQTGTATVEELANVAPRKDQNLQTHKRVFCATHGVPERTCIPIGFHGDGVPFQKSTHKNSSTEVYSWNFLCDRDGKRYLFANIHKEFLCKCGCAGRCTFNALFAVFVWSMQILLGGIHPQERHDGAPLDAARAKLTKRKLGFQAVLLQARGDWQWFNQVFQFPSWSSGRICWRCKASQEGKFAYWKCGPRAAWRKTRYTAGEFLAQQLQEGVEPSPLFSCPGFTIEMICIGALHCLDAGVTQDILGNILWEAVRWLSGLGRTQEIRVQELWARLQTYYSRHKITGGLQGLTLLMIKQPGKAPKLRSKAAQARHLIGFGKDIAQLLHYTYQSWHTALVLEVVTALQEVQHVMDKAWDPALASDLSVKIGEGLSKLNAEALAYLKADAKLEMWRLKPKLHMMQELLEYQSFLLGNPRGFWEYMDEDFVGVMSTLALKGGGRNTHKACSFGVLDRYRALLSLGQV